MALVIADESAVEARDQPKGTSKPDQSKRTPKPPPKRQPKASPERSQKSVGTITTKMFIQKFLTKNGQKQKENLLAVIWAALLAYVLAVVLAGPAGPFWLVQQSYFWLVS